MEKRYAEASREFEIHLKANPGHLATQQWLKMLNALSVKTPPAATVSHTEKAPGSRDDEIRRLRREVREAEVLAQRAISQTKRALGLAKAPPQPLQPSGIPPELTEEIQNLRISNYKLGEELRQKADTIDRLRQKINNVKQAQDKPYDQAARTIRDLTAKNRELEITIKEFSSLYAQAESSKKVFDRRLAQALQEKKLLSGARLKLASAEQARNDMKLQLASAEQVRDQATKHLQTKEMENVTLTNNLMQNKATLERERRSTANTFKQMRELTESARQKNLLLAKSLQKERTARAELEAKIATMRRESAEMKTKLNKLTRQITQAIPQLQSIRNSMDAPPDNKAPQE